MQANFRPIEATDVVTVSSMMEAFYAIDGYPIDVEVSKGLLKEFIMNEALGQGWLILQDSEPVGYIIMTFVFSFEYKGRIAFLDELYISPTARGLGFGKQALDFIQQQAKQLFVKIIYLEIETHNKIAQKLYLSKNYTIHNRGLMKLVVQ